MAVLRPQILRFATYSTVLALSIHFATLLLLPLDSPLGGFIQVSIAAVCLGALVGVVLADYRRGGSLMRRIEEEILVIAIFGLFWLSFATILRVYGRDEDEMMFARQSAIPVTTPAARAKSPHLQNHRQYTYDKARQDAKAQPQQTTAPKVVIPTPVVPTPMTPVARDTKVKTDGGKSYVIMREWVYREVD
ncbi:hypothetical protein FRB96_000140 [Tulasnella sp. 330]|nr:hypothetical protein FRB96_000140 [Tulasnella sp. 330]KAG8885870.1 hypothetical protein FRB97_009032 [Tulasnella sp. 331]KAG8891041.1 hypothetical protein FRB98_000050 [Tulasnella sp. 332]